ncbi:hypothetical protein [Bergeyella zoohelcum]|uniref:Uncharacterized protein n=1 Tax=Bergeyella zoohelcum TaxID=1015 RepID=A0A7Z9CHR1_9FLAO|nr:hypothetical protein [Bergeyella zoohelcum]VDH05846.1 Uncharacterised protein [Bergeyella zoohelcum]
MRKKQSHILKEIKLISKDLLEKDMSNDEILHIAQKVNSIYCTPGTAKMTIELKQDKQGSFFEKKIMYSVPSTLLPSELNNIFSVGAIVVSTEKEFLFVFYSNDYQSNAPFSFDISSDEKKTIISFSTLSLNYD